MAILKANCIPLGMELFPGWGVKIWPHIQESIDECEFYILVIGHRYGSTSKVRGKPISWTEREFDYALKRGKKIIIFLPKNRDKLKIQKFSKNQERVRKLFKAGKKLNQKDKRTLQTVLRIIEINRNNSNVKKFISKIEKRDHFTKRWGSSDDLAHEVRTELLSYIKSENPKIGWVKTSQIPGLSIVSLNHTMIKDGKDYSKVIDIYNEKKSSRSTITKATPLAEKLFVATDQSRTISIMQKQFRNKEDFTACWNSGAFTADPSGKITIQSAWGGDYTLLYALCYVHKNKYYESNASRKIFESKPVKEWWDLDMIDVAIYASLVCDEKVLVSGLTNLIAPINHNSYSKSISLVYRIIQLRPSIGSYRRVSEFLDKIISFEEPT